MWGRKYSDKLSWLQELESKGLKPAALKEKPELLPVEMFYLELFNIVGGEAFRVISLNEMYRMDTAETMFAVETVFAISAILRREESKNASNQT